MKLQAVLLVFISILALSMSQFCGSQVECSQDYDSTCPADESCHLYDNCMTSDCNTAIEPTQSL